ncbi:hypothetical protein [Gracilimonas amylolytica]|uniref:hypothetical protein n=1 Tax=Gracilimonas amylolytica TaxID=1749045 RepID=UPI000CD9EA96|nr:hypothetical protein [Gracilimonas amylolytica]
MRKIFVSYLAVLGILLSACEMPDDPNFRTSHRIEAPVMYNKTFQFMGQGSNVLIDTTSSDFDSLFSVDGDNFITISKQEDFDFGDLNDAIPEVDVTPTTFDTEIGEIEIGSFSSGSGGNLGEASFQEITGLNPALFSAGTPIPGGQTPTPVNIQVGANTDYFVSATIKNGSVELTLTNDLGFDIDAADIDLRSGSTVITTTTFNNVTHGSNVSGQFVFDNGDVLQDLNVDVSVTWSAQTSQDNPGSLIVDSLEGVDLVASEVEAAVEAQTFESSDVTTLDNTEFQFTEAAHYVELQSGDLMISEIINNLDITIENMTISFPGIRTAPYAEGDSLVIVYNGATEITRNGSAPARSMDLSGYRIFAEGNQVEYKISAQTENTQEGSGSETRVISETDNVAATVSINNLQIAEAFGVIVSKEVLLGDDDPNNGVDQLDLYNDTEAELTEIDGLEDLSDKLDGIEFTEPTISIDYTTNLEVGATVYGAFLGINSNNEVIYLTGDAGSEYEVTTQVPGLNANGVALEPEDLIKFDIDTNTGSGSINFDASNTNVDDFLNNLPDQIRFIGKAMVNENNEAGTVTSPIEFEPTINVNIPLALRTTQAATFTDTTDQDLGDLPSTQNGDDSRLTEGRIIIDYTNGIPLEIDLEVTFMDENYTPITSIPISGDELKLMASGIDQGTQFANAPSSGSMQIVLNESQLEQLYQTRYLEISAWLLTTDTNSDGVGDDVRIRTTDAITLSVSADLSIETEVN